MKIDLRIHTVFSIKEKRQLVNSIKSRLASRFKVAVAEVEDQDLYNSALLGLCFISLKKNDAVAKVQNIVKFLEDNVSDVFNDYNYVIEEY